MNDKEILELALKNGALQHHNDIIFIASEFQAFAKELMKIQREKDAEMCLHEMLVDNTGMKEDIAYNCAVNHCSEAIRKGGE